MRVTKKKKKIVKEKNRKKRNISKNLSKEQLKIVENTYDPLNFDSIFYICCLVSKRLYLVENAKGERMNED